MSHDYFCLLREGKTFIVPDCPCNLVTVQQIFPFAVIPDMRWRTGTIDKGMKGGRQWGKDEVWELTAGMMEVKGVKHKIISALFLIQAVPAGIRSVRCGCRGLTCGPLAPGPYVVLRPRAIKHWKELWPLHGNRAQCWCNRGLKRLQTSLQKRKWKIWGCFFSLLCACVCVWKCHFTWCKQTLWHCEIFVLVVSVWFYKMLFLSIERWQNGFYLDN